MVDLSKLPAFNFTSARSDLKVRPLIARGNEAHGKGVSSPCELRCGPCLRDEIGARLIEEVSASHQVHESPGASQHLARPLPRLKLSAVPRYLIFR